jgi:DNA primase
VIPEAVIDEIRARVDAVAVIGRHVELKRSGRTFKACCPFHGERTPSFHVYPEDKHFKCYGCGEHGDVFKFLQKLQGKEFPEVVRALAQEVGVAIPEREEDSAEQRRRREERREVLAACDAAARYFAARLWSAYGEPGASYLRARGVAEPIARAFRLGLASSDWDDLTPRLGRKGIQAAALEKAGLVARREGGGAYDRFRGRLVFPIAAADGEVIGFGGRTLPGAPDRLAKYINSPESLLYKKSRVLYGIDLAREHIRRTRSAVLVEGYFDVIALHQAGVKNAVAVCGTALTPEHVEALQRLDCRTLTLLFDGDAAGVEAATKAAASVLPSGLAGRVALLQGEGGKVDPDEFARAQGADAVEKLVASAQPLTEYLIDRAICDHCGPSPAESSFEQRSAAVRQLRPLLDAARGLAKSILEDRVAKRIGVDAKALSRELGTYTEMEARAGPGAAPARTQVRSDLVSKGSKGSKALDALGVLAAFPELVDVAREERFLDLFTGTPLELIARGLVEQTLDGPGTVSRLEPLLPAQSIGRVKKLLAEARPEPAGAEREFRKATVEAKIEQLGDEIDRLSAEVASAGSPIPDHLRSAMLVAKSRRADLEKRRDGRRPG